MMPTRTSAPAHAIVTTACTLLALTTLTDTASAQQNILRGGADPAIIKGDDGRYYVYATGRGLPFYRSADLVEWQRIGRVFDRSVPEWAPREVPGTRGIWAPDITFYRGKFWLYYAVSTFGSQRSCIGLATNVTLNPDDPRYKWHDHGKVLESAPGKTNFNAIDPAAFTDQQGTRWLTWGSFWDGIKLVQLDPETGRPVPGATIHSLARRPLKHAIEAPFVVYRDGYYYLFVSFDSCCDGVRSTYNIRIGRSRRPTGPYLDTQGRPMLEGGGSLILASHENWRGPGHNSVLHTPKGDFLAHHTYDAREVRGVRNLQIRPLLWDAAGWPLAGEPLTPENVSIFGPNATAKPPAKIDPTGKWQHWIDYASPRDIELLPDGDIRGADGASWKLNGTTLELYWPDTEAPGGLWIDRCIPAPDGRSYVGRNQAGQVLRGIRPPAP